MSYTPKIYVADLAAYNAGCLHGVWIDACQDLEDIHQDIAAMLADSPIAGAEEYAIHDYDDFAGYRVHEYDRIERVAAAARLIAEYGARAAAVLDHWSGDVEGPKHSLEEDYCGEYDSLADFAEEFTGETCAIPPNLAYYIDYERMAADMEINDVYTVEEGGKVHVFWNR
jgi:antirestriction protein